MASMSCHHCGEQLASGFVVCPRCGALQARPAQTDHWQRDQLFLIVLGFSLFGALLGYLVGVQFWVTALGAVSGLVVGMVIAGLLASRLRVR
jgi:membrane associated rhomboid family serine protease